MQHYHSYHLLGVNVIPEKQNYPRTWGRGEWAVRGRCSRFVCLAGAGVAAKWIPNTEAWPWLLLPNLHSQSHEALLYCWRSNDSALVAAPVPSPLKTSGMQACGRDCLSLGCLIIIWNGVLPREGRKGSPWLSQDQELKDSNLLGERKKRASNSNKKVLQMWNWQESRESKPIFSRSGCTLW